MNESCWTLIHYVPIRPETEQPAEANRLETQVWLMRKKGGGDKKNARVRDEDAESHGDVGGGLRVSQGTSRVLVSFDGDGLLQLLLVATFLEGSGDGMNSAIYSSHVY